MTNLKQKKYNEKEAWTIIIIFITSLFLIFGGGLVVDFFEAPITGILMIAFGVAGFFGSGKLSDDFMKKLE